MPAVPPTVPAADSAIHVSNVRIQPAPASAGRRGQRGSRYAALVRCADVAVVVAVVAIGVAAGLGAGDAADHARGASGFIAGVLVLCALLAFRTADPTVLGVGADEYRRVFRAFVTADVVLAMAGLALHVQSVRVWVFLLVPLACLACVLVRQCLRVVLHRRRRAGHHLRDVLVVGSVEGVRELVARTLRDPGFGWRVTGACTPTGTGPDGALHVDGVPVVGDLDAVSRLAGAVDVVAVAPTSGWGPKRLQRLAWDLEGTSVDLAVDPGLMEIAGPRLHITPVDGMPLLRLTSPRLTGGARFVKDVVDRVGALALLLVIAPVLAVVALAVRLDGGPVFFRQERVGKSGSPFRMVKFRSMVVDAEAGLAALQAVNDGAGPLFKMRDDPRVTRVGTFIRKYSLDELPQLFNVLAGSMSLVGPRPPLEREVAAYGPDARRKLLVKPGMTGLWQVSGRSDLSWEESVRLDLRYVENWSLTLDLSILWRTVGAMVNGGGAY